jgi:hypothetical protein
MATKVRQPGFQLLSLFTPQEANSTLPSYADTICLLPNQSYIYTRGYLPFFAVTLAILLIFNLRRANSSRQLTQLTSPSNHQSSPPISPIQYKSSLLHAPGLRSATTLSPYSSQPGTPIGGAPYLSNSWAPSIPDDEDTQELLIWEKQNSNTKLSPYIPNESPGVDSSYFLPSPSANTNETKNKAVWLSAFASGAQLTSRTYFPALQKPFVMFGRCVLFTGRKRARTWHGRFLQDVLRVALFPTCLYILVVFWSLF